MTRPRHVRLLTLSLSLIALSVVTRWLSLAIEVIDMDEACHLIGARILAGGPGTLYTHFVDNKPPLLYALYALLERAGGGGLLGVHIATVAGVVPLTALGLSAFFRHDRRGTTAAVAYVVASAAFIGHDMLATNAELLMLLPATWALVAIARRVAGAPVWTVWLAGVLFGVAGLIKPQIGAWILVLTPWLLLDHSSRAWRERARSVMWLIIGGLTVVRATYAWFAHHGAAADLMYWAVWHNVWYADNPIAPREALQRFAAFFVTFVLVTWPLWWATLRSWRAERTSEQRLLSALVAASLVPAFLGLRFYPHYFIQLYVPLALAGAPVLTDLLTRPATRMSRVVIVWTLVMSLGWTAANAIAYLGPRRIYQEQHPALTAVAARIRQDPCAPGPLFVWGWTPSIYYYAQQPLASRFVVVPQARLTGYVPGNLESNRGRAAETAPVDAHWDWLFDDFSRTPPTFIVDTAPARLYHWDRYPLSRYPRLRALVDQEFDLIAEVNGVHIYRRRNCLVTGSTHDIRERHESGQRTQHDAPSSTGPSDAGH